MQSESDEKVFFGGNELRSTTIMVWRLHQNVDDVSLSNLRISANIVVAAYSFLGMKLCEELNKYAFPLFVVCSL